MENKGDIRDRNNCERDKNYYENEPVHQAGTSRPAMDIGLRAKQFMPFAAVVGLNKALEEKVKEREKSDR